MAEGMGHEGVELASDQWKRTLSFTRSAERASSSPKGLGRFSEVVQSSSHDSQEVYYSLCTPTDQPHAVAGTKLDHALPRRRVLSSSLSFHAPSLHSLDDSLCTSAAHLTYDSTSHRPFIPTLHCSSNVVASSSAGALLGRC